MTKELRPLKKVGEDFLNGAPNVPTLRVRLPFPAKLVWAALADSARWSEWTEGAKIFWKSEPPHQKGSCRVVETSNDIIEEIFFSWDEGKRLGFYFSKTTLPVQAAAESYEVTDTDTDTDTENACELRWTFRVEADPPIAKVIQEVATDTIKKRMPSLEAFLRTNRTDYGG